MSAMIEKNMNWKQFETVQSMQESQNQAIYQASTIWFYGKDTWRKRIPESWS